MAGKKDMERAEDGAGGVVEKKEPKKKVPTPAQCKRIFQKGLAESFEAIVAGFVKEAKKGSCPHVKLANELLETAIEEKALQKKGPAERMVEEWIRGEKPESKKVRGADGRFVKGED